MGDLVRFLDLVKPFTPILPEVSSPEARIPFNQKLMWTGVGAIFAQRDGLPPRTTCRGRS